MARRQFAPSLASRFQHPVSPLHLIDAIGPFFRGHDRRTINWSKIPWESVPTGPDRSPWWECVRRDLDSLADQASRWGFNAASIDDVSHLVDHEGLETGVRGRIAVVRDEMRRCFEVFRSHGMALFVTMDVFSATPGLRKALSDNRTPLDEYLADLIDRFLAEFPEVAGVILRIGETDGKDVQDDFRSELAIQKPEQARRLLNVLLPRFERHGKTLVFRTWTVGAYPIGDLMWHRETFRRVFEGIDSPALIISMKYGESDFFRYLPLNRNFFRTRIPKIVELQARREYEGCGEYPSFVGWEYERYTRELRQAENLVGCMVWCQTGGWVPFRRLAFLDKEALWIDLNTFTTLRVVRDGWTVEECVRTFAAERGMADADALLELLRLSDECVRELLYVEDFARQKLFFRRVRIPPLLQVYWGNIFISHSIKKVMRYFVRDPEESLRAAARCMENFAHMRTLALRAGAPVEDIEYMHDTFRLLSLGREYCLTRFTPGIEQRLRDAKRAYKAKYPKRGLRARYRVKMDFDPLFVKRRYLGWAIQLLMRRQRGYRWIDRILTLHLLSLIYRVIAKRRPDWIPRFARESAMGVDVVFK